MITIECWVEGTTPLLMHRATEEGLGGSGARANTLKENDDPRTIAGRAVYRFAATDQLAVPGAAFARMLREAGGSHKARGSRKSVKFLVPAAVLVLDELCGLYLRDRKTAITDFEVDSRPVTIPATKGRIMRHRARLNEWASVVTLRINEALMAEAMVRQLFVEGSQQIGIGDFRPEKGGPFGTSSIVAWDVVSDRKPVTPAQKRNGAGKSTELAD
jgi:hypothetical protein